MSESGCFVQCTERQAKSLSARIGTSIKTYSYDECFYRLWDGNALCCDVLGSGIGYFVGAIFVVNEPEIWDRKTCIEAYEVITVYLATLVPSMLLGNLLQSLQYIQAS
jgi:hypothetical protein